MGDEGYRLDALRFDAGPAWLNLIATLGNAYGAVPVERLTGPPRLAEWFAHHGLTPATRPVSADVAHARDLREVLRPLGLAAAAGRRLPAAEVRALDAVLAGAEPLRVRAAGARGLTVARPADARRALARVAADAARGLTDPETRLGTCADPECGLLFADPGGRRRWCSSTVCGVRHRVREHRARCSPPQPSGSD